MLEAHITGGLLDRILKTPEGQTLDITREDAFLIRASGLELVSGGPQILTALFEGRDFDFMGRRIHVIR